MVRRYQRKQRYLQELPAATNNAEVIAAAAKANILYDGDAYVNPVNSADFTSPAHKNYEDDDKNIYDLTHQTDAKNYSIVFSCTFYML